MPVTRGALLQRERRPVPLNLITGRSPQNCRQAIAGDDRSGLAASMIALEAATGEPLIAPLIVSAVPGSALLAFHVHAGGRRWETLRDLAADGTFRPDRPIDCLVVDGDDAAIATEISLFENSLRRDLHPVEQCDAFEALRAGGVDEARIAADFALPLRTVKQRLRLTRLAPAVRSAWRDGKLTTDQAAAFAVGDSVAAQDELLERVVKSQHMGSGWHPMSIRREMLDASKAASFDTREARYVGLDAYVAAGGRVEEDLFAEVPLIFDEALLKRLARETMMAAGEAILAAEGYGFCFAMEDIENATWCFWERIEWDYTEAEQARLDAIEEETDALFDGSDDAAQARLEAEAEAIVARAYARVATPELRARAGILVAIDPDGTLHVERGLFAPPAVKDKPPSAEAPYVPPAPAAPAKPPKPADPIEAAAGGLGMIRTILDDTVTKALVAIVAVRPDLALLFAVARFGGSYAPDQLEREFGIGRAVYAADLAKREGVLGRLDGKSFDAAIALCADVPLSDLTVAFAAIAARSIRLARHATLAGLEPVVRAFARRGAGLGPAFRKAFDADRYFEAATRAACLGALEAMGTANVERGAKKPVLAALAAAEAKKKGWLPYPLAGWAAIDADSAEAEVDEPVPAPPLAQAMGDALEAGALRREIEWLAFLTARTIDAPGAVLRAVDLVDAFNRDRTPDGFELAEICDLLFELGFEEATGRGALLAYRDLALLPEAMA